jgi:hypothetical protein
VALSSVATADSDWELRLEMSTHAALPGEPVLATATIVYRGEMPFLGYVSFGRSGLWRVGPSGERWGAALSSSTFGHGDEVPPARAMTYPAGYQRSAEEVVFASASSRDQDRPEPGLGRFEMFAEIWAGTNLEGYRPIRLTSNRAPVRVLPLPKEEIAPFALWCGSREAEMFLTGHGDEAAQQALRTLIERYRGSRYAKYALMALAQGKRWQREHLSTGPVVPPERLKEWKRLAAEEVALLERVIMRWSAFHLAPVALDRLIELARLQLQDWERVEKYAKMLLRIPNAPESYRTRAEDALAAVARVRAAGSG